MTTGKTGLNTGRFGPGHDPRRGHGLLGRSGRKRLAFVDNCRALTDYVVIEKIGLYLQDPERGPADPAWRWCSEYVTRYTKVEPREPIEAIQEKIPLSLLREAIARAEQKRVVGGKESNSPAVGQCREPG